MLWSRGVVVVSERNAVLEFCIEITRRAVWHPSSKATRRDTRSLARSVPQGKHCTVTCHASEVKDADTADNSPAYSAIVDARLTGERTSYLMPSISGLSTPTWASDFLYSSNFSMIRESV